MDIDFDYSLFDGAKAYKVDMSILKSEISKLEEIVVMERGKEDVDLEHLKILVGNLVKLRIIRDWRNG